MVSLPMILSDPSRERYYSTLNISEMVQDRHIDTIIFYMITLLTP